MLQYTSSQFLKKTKIATTIKYSQKTVRINQLNNNGDLFVYLLVYLKVFDWNFR